MAEAVDQSTNKASMKSAPISREVEWDLTSTWPLTHLSFILETLIPTWHPMVANTKHVRDFRDQLLRRYEAEYEGDPDKRVIFTGSFTELVAIPSFVKRTKDQLPTAEYLRKEFERSDIDMMIEAIGKTVGSDDSFDRQTETSTTRPGYLRVFYTDSSMTGDFCLHRDGKVYLSSAKMMTAYLNQSKISLIADGLATRTQGPALTMTSPDSMDNDIVICLPCPKWPNEAAEWITRSRSSGWPPQALRDEIVAAGCHVVPVAHRHSAWPEAEWRFSFAQAETKLCHSFSLNQRRCYMLLKLVVKNELTPPGLVTSYCLKNLYFRTMETLSADNWEDKGWSFAAVFLYLLDQLMYALISQDLPHYFIPQNNLFSNIPEDFLDDLMKKVSRIRRAPVKYLLSFDKTYMLPYSPIRTTFADSFEPITSQLPDFNIPMTQCKNQHANCMNLLITQYLNDCQFDGAFAVCEQLCQLLKNHGGQIRSPYGYMDFKARELEPNYAVLVYEFLLKKNPEEASKVSLTGNMACMYTSLYSQETDQTKKTNYLKKADTNFQKALSYHDVSGATAVDYAIFLRTSGRSNEAIPLLQKFLPKENNLKSSNAYGPSEKPSLDENLQAEIDAESKEISTYSLIWGFYHLVMCYIDTDQQDQAKELLPDFAAACKLEEVSTDSLAYSLLGYVYWKLEQYKLAAEAFGKGVEIKPDYALADENQDTCEGLALSMEQ